MGRKATKASGNIFYEAREEAMKENDAFSSRERAASIIGIDRTRLARIELSEVLPYQEEVKLIARAYDRPELCNQYCTTLCPLGSMTTKKVRMDNLDRLILNILGSLKDVSEIKDSLIDISADGMVDETERQEFMRILDILSEISDLTNSLELWARKNLDDIK
ncbi:MAG: hypothetical protein NC089_10125 [Bacteroides sp.]|nr:hypothetical protein [Bacteroides sp.]MCM1550318.1 XRE family transcriptional regulator [Clostridium sp.]